MKKEYVIIVLMHFTLMAIGQLSTDTEWLILNGVGKNGVNQAGVNVYPVSPSAHDILNQDFTLDRIKHPDRILPLPADSRSKNDLFIIYSDWTHFNSRSKGIYSYTSTNDPFYPHTGQGSLSDSIHSLRIANTNQTIVAAYMSNLYEKDDPPGTVRAVSGRSGQNSVSYQVGTTSPGAVVTASHNVVYDKDLTLIIDNRDNILRDSAVLYLDTIKVGNQIYTGNYFQASSILSSTQTSGFCNVPGRAMVNGSKIILNGISANRFPFVYINVTPTSGIEEFLPGGSLSGGSASFVLHTVNSSGNAHYSLVESILAAYDPNFIRVMAACKKDNDSQFVTYYVEFENKGTTNARNVKLSLKVPEYLDVNCISKIEQKLSGSLMTDGVLKVYPDRDSIVFLFPGKTLPGLDMRNPIRSKGSVAFCIKVDSGVDLKDIHSVLQFINPEIYFGSRSEPITDFIDLRKNFILDDSGIVVKTERPVSASDCGCFCPWRVGPAPQGFPNKNYKIKLNDLKP